MTKKYYIPTMAEVSAIKPNGLKVISTFSGGGGSCTGYRMAGFQVLWANEFIPEAAKTYKANHPNSMLDQRDIRKVKPEDILADIGMQVGELDLFDGSPPCSAFSAAGKREKGWGEVKAYSDDAHQVVDDLFFEYARLVKGIQPKVFIAENVAGLIKGKAKGYFKEIYQQLQDCGYHVICKVLDAQWLGVPQMRARTIFVGIRNDLWKPEYEGITHPKPFEYQVTLAEAFADLEFTEQDREQTDLSRYSIYPLLKTLRPGTSHLKRFTLSKGTKHRQSYCVTATNGNIGAGNTCHWDNRAYTVSEIKRIMSIPDDYVLTGTYGKQVERCGRMVAPLVMKAVAENLLKLGVFDGSTK